MVGGDYAQLAILGESVAHCGTLLKVFFRHINVATITKLVALLVSLGATPFSDYFSLNTSVFFDLVIVAGAKFFGKDFSSALLDQAGPLPAHLGVRTNSSVFHGRASLGVH